MITSEVSSGDYTKTNEYNNLRDDGPACGAIVLYPLSSAPTDWLLCDGSAVSRVTYSDLFAVIGTTYGVGDGSTTFNLPDLQDRFPYGKDGSTSLGDTNAGTHTIATAELPVHTHTIPNYLHQHTTSPAPSSGFASPPTTRILKSTSAGQAYLLASSGGSHDHGGSTGSTGSGTSINLTPEYFSLIYIIKI